MSGRLVDLLQAIKSFATANTPVIRLKTGDSLSRAGETENHIYYIVSGGVKACLLVENEEHIIRFGYNGSVINALPSFYLQQPSEMYLEAIRETKYHALKRIDFTRLVEQSDDMMRSYIALLEMLVVQQMERETDLLVKSPQERILRVMQRSPQLFQEIPHKYIAAYLRMTAETFSRALKSCAASRKLP